MTTKKSVTPINLGKCSECKKDYNRAELGTCTVCNGFLCYKCSCDCDSMPLEVIAELAAFKAA